MRRSTRLIILLVVTFALTCGCAGYAQQNRTTPKSIFADYKTAVVQVFADGRWRGTGFVIAADTVVTTDEVVAADSQGYLSNLEVRFADGERLKASPAAAARGDKGPPREHALLRLQGRAKGPFLQLGGWADVSEGDELIIIGFPADPPTPLLITATLAGRFHSPRGDLLIFQGPANRGLSGAPLISAQTGAVVGTLTTSVAGQGARAVETTTAQPTARPRTGGADALSDLRNITDVRDDFFPRGIGYAVAIDHVKASHTNGDR
jgi:hypothetical protein